MTETPGRGSCSRHMPTAESHGDRVGQVPVGQGRGAPGFWAGPHLPSEMELPRRGLAGGRGRQVVALKTSEAKQLGDLRLRFRKSRPKRQSRAEQEGLEALRRRNGETGCRHWPRPVTELR